MNNNPVIKISDLQFAWKKQAQLVLDIDSLQVNEGERVFLRGPSGSGKSTLLSLLAAVTSPQCGELKVLGQDLKKLGHAKRDQFRADHIGFIFQMFNLLPYLGVIENVLLPLHFSAQRKDRVLKSGSMKDEALRILAHLDLSGEDILSRATHELSVGQQQRVAAARALIGSPEIVIADEPTSSLDTDRRDAFIDLLVNECNENKSTLIFVSHDKSLESHFDRSISLSEINQARSRV